METLNTDFRLLPVTGEPGFAAHLLLRLAQGSSRPLETVERGKAANPQVDADSPALWQGRLERRARFGSLRTTSRRFGIR